MQLHTLLASDISAFDFESQDFDPVTKRFPRLDIVNHRDPESFLACAGHADYLLTWDFEAGWYARCPRLKAILTPAAGNEWVSSDPDGRVELIHGTFHGKLLGESLLQAILFMNHRMPAMIRNFERRGWDRNLQRDCRILANQTVLILGLGHIGAEFADMLTSLGVHVIGVKRNPATLSRPLDGVEVVSAEGLDEALPRADHIVVLLPGVTSTDRILDHERLTRCKPGAFVYNFGRGNAIATTDLVAALDHLGGAFLDVVDEEPLDPESPLWRLENVMITPHSSCVYREYRPSFVDEVVTHLERLVGDSL